MLSVISIIGKDLDNIDYTQDKIDIQAALDKQLYFNIEQFSLESMQSPINTLQMAAGGTHYLMFMEKSKSEFIWSSSLCDFTTSHTDYLCKPCKPYSFSPSFTFQKCIPCDTMSNYYSLLSQQETNKLLFLCGDFANKRGYLGFSKIGLGLGLSIALAMIVFALCCIYIRKRRNQRR